MAAISDDPNSPRPARAADNDKATPVWPPHGILVVDDDHDAADSLALLLTLLGHEVRTVYDGPAALRAAHGRLPRFVLLDIGLPGMDGYEVARRLREQPGRDAVRVIALTGYGREEDKRRAREAGCDAHLTKPADLDALYVLLATESTEKSVCS